MLLLISIVLLILEHFMSDAVFTNQSKSFKAIRSASNLTSLCAIDKPTEVIKVEDLNLSPINMVSPSQETLCAWRCTRESNCTGYNWKKCSNECGFYSYAPKTCKAISGCTHYGSRDAHSCIEIIECPTNWVQKDDFCYYVSSGPLVNATTAQSKCKTMNATLVTISSQVLNSFITNISAAPSGQEFWIGLHKKTCVPAGETYWLDGNAASYRNWLMFDPNDFVCCVRLVPSGVWTDKGCGEVFQYICQLKLQS